MIDYTPSKPFSAYSGPRRPKILFIAEAWGREEDETKRPLVGESGKELWRMLGESAQGSRHEIHNGLWSEAARLHIYGAAWVRKREEWMEATGIAFTNVLNLRPPGNKLSDPSISLPKKELENKGKNYPSHIPAIQKGRYLRPEFFPELVRLGSEIADAKPNLVVALGATAAWALLRSSEIGAIRGTTVLGSWPRDGIKVLPTYHPASVIYNWSNRPILVADLMKGWREADFAEIRRPDRRIEIDPTIERVREFAAWLYANADSIPLLSIDTETESRQIKCISFAWSKWEAFVIPIWGGGSSRSYWSEEEEIEVWGLVERTLLTPIPKLFQNGVYDLQYLFAHHLRIRNALHDAMLLSHALFPEMPKGLGFLGSIHTDEPAWKLMRRRRPDTEKRDE